MVYLYIFITLAGTVLGQLMLKSRVHRVGEMPPLLKDGMIFEAKALLDRLVMLILFLATGVGWMRFITWWTWAPCRQSLSLGWAASSQISRHLSNESSDVGCLEDWYSYLAACWRIES
jgi:hypothetical protein